GPAGADNPLRRGGVPGDGRDRRLLADRGAEAARRPGVGGRLPARWPAAAGRRRAPEPRPGPHLPPDRRRRPGGPLPRARRPTARELVKLSDRVGGLFSEKDFADHTSTWVEPVSTTYRGYTVWELPPNGQGIAALQMLNLLEGYDLTKFGPNSADYWHLFLEA